MKKLLLGFMLAAALLVGCKKEPALNEEGQKKNSDCVFQVFNASSHTIEVWPEITMGFDVIPYKNQTKKIKAGGLVCFYLNSEKLFSDIDSYQKKNSTNLDINSKVWLICGVKQTDTGTESWTSGWPLGSCKNTITSCSIKDDLDDRKQASRYSYIKDTEDSNDFSYTFNNNTGKTIFVSNYLYKDDNPWVFTEYKKVEPNGSCKYFYNLQNLKEKYPGYSMGVAYYNENLEFIASGWRTELIDFQIGMIFNVNSLDDSSKNHKQIVSQNKFIVKEVPGVFEGQNVFYYILLDSPEEYIDYRNTNILYSIGNRECTGVYYESCKDKVEEMLTNGLFRKVKVNGTDDRLVLNNSPTL